MSEDLELEHEYKCDTLSRKSAQWIYGQLAGMRGTHYRGLTDLESCIYAWLIEHAVFDDDTGR